MRLATQLPQYTIEELWEKPMSVIYAWTTSLRVLKGDEVVNERLTDEDEKALEFLKKNKENIKLAMKEK